jgi:SAM-dependent methyltransferase
MAKDRMQWSKSMEDLYLEQVHRQVQFDKRTDWEEGKNISLGFPFQVILKEVLELGRADFTSGYQDDEYGTLTAEDKALLYCFVCMKRHFYEALATFRAYKARLRAVFESGSPSVMADLGCGPGTAGLALCECLERPRVIYVGLDIAAAMRNKAKSMLNAAKDRSLLNANSNISVTSSWQRLARLPTEYTKPVNLLFNATYLFSSDSLQVAGVCETVMAFKQSAAVRQILFVYSNTTTDISGEKFREFKRQLKGEFTSDGLIKCEREYHKRRGSDATSKTEFVRQLLIFRA